MFSLWNGDANWFRVHRLLQSLSDILLGFSFCSACRLPRLSETVWAQGSVAFVDAVYSNITSVSSSGPKDSQLLTDTVINMRD